MTNEEIRIAVAEELGIPVNVCMCGEHFNKHGTFCCHSFVPMADEHEVPDYPNSRDACAEFEATLDSSELYDYYYEHLYGTVKPSGAHHSMQVFRATARQRCEAFLRLRGRWKEESK